MDLLGVGVYCIVVHGIGMHGESMHDVGVHSTWKRSMDMRRRALHQNVQMLMLKGRRKPLTVKEKGLISLLNCQCLNFAKTAKS
jgi:hypothetical protein